MDLAQDRDQFRALVLHGPNLKLIFVTGAYSLSITRTRRLIICREIISEEYCLLGSDSVQSGRSLPTFRGECNASTIKVKE
jgi:hypothetical protein